MTSWHTLSVNQTLTELNSSEHGLSASISKERLTKYGENKLKEKPPTSPIVIFINQFKSFLVALLLVAVAISAAIGHVIDAAVIGVIIVINGILGFTQEFKAEKAMQALKKLSAPKAKIIRNGEHKTIPASELVPGDIILLEEGDRIPADARLIQAFNLKIDEASLTGESTPVDKVIEELSKQKLVVSERKNCVFMNTIVTYGRGTAVVTETGMNSEIGHIAKLIQEEDTEPTPLQNKLKDVAKTLGIAIIIICAVMFGVGVFRGVPVFDMFITAVALAVAAVPEGLPAVVTITLAIGLKRMAQVKAIIRKLPVVETLGAATTICVPGYTPVMCNPSHKPISEIGEGEKVLGSDGEFHEVNKTFKRMYEGEIIGIKPVGLPRMEFTLEHPILIAKLKKSRPYFRDSNEVLHRPRKSEIKELAWVHAKDITINDWVIVPRVKDSKQFNLKFRRGKPSVREEIELLLDKELSELFGWYLAEGCTSTQTKYGSYRAVFYLGKHETENINRLKYLIENKLGLKSDIRETATAVRISFSNQDIVKFLNENFGKLAHLKKIPRFIFNTSQDNVIAFIRAYLKGDGNISQYYIRFSTVSRTLAYQLILLLAKVGIRCRIHKRIGKDSQIEGRLIHGRDSYEIFVSGSQASKVHSTLKELHHQKRNFFLYDKNYVFYPIRFITKEIKKLYVYNIETGSSTYCLPFVVHNCSDKTGTLTKNEMTVREIYTNKKTYKLTGIGYEPKGEFLFENKKVKIDKNLDTLLRASTLCTTASLYHDKKWLISGDPTEGALIVAAAKAGLIKDKLLKEYRHIDEIPFDSNRKVMSIIYERKKKIAYVKGAAEIILSKCTRIFENGKIRKITATDKKLILSKHKDMAMRALRILGVAYRVMPNVKKYNPKNTEKDLVFIGLEGMIDPPRNEAKTAINLCKEAGIRVIMITGDHEITARAIGKELGIISDSINGEEVDSKLKDVIDKTSIYARVSPEHKVAIVNALKSKGQVVAMTGDGVNDAPALKKADIGVAMGIKGTDVAKEASDMVLEDDNFATIVSAVREGRNIYDDIRKFILYLLSCNVGEIMAIFGASLIGLPIPLLAVQILWMNLLTDGLPALALGVEPPGEDVMQRTPRNPKEHTISNRMISNIGIVGIVLAIGTLAVFRAADPSANLAYAQTMAFSTLVMHQMFNVFNTRSEKSIFKTDFFSNKYLLLAVAGSIILQIVVVYVPFMQPLFGTVSLGAMDWVKIVSVSASVIVVVEIWKAITNKVTTNK